MKNNSMMNEPNRKTSMALRYKMIFTYLNTVSVSIAFFILKIYFGVQIGVSFSWWNLESLNLLDGKVDPDDFSHRCIG